MLNTAIVGLGWWGKTLVKAAHDFGAPLRFVRGVTLEPDTVRDFAAEQKHRHRHLVRGGAGRPVDPGRHAGDAAHQASRAGGGDRRRRQASLLRKAVRAEQSRCAGHARCLQARRHRDRRRPSFPADAVDARAGRAEGGRRLRHDHACGRQLQPRLAGELSGRQLAHAGGGKPRRRHDRHGHPRARLFPRSWSGR